MNSYAVFFLQNCQYLVLVFFFFSHFFVTKEKMETIAKKMFIEISPETALQYFDGTSDCKKAGYLHSVFISTYYYYVKKRAPLHTYGKKICNCSKCRLLEVFKSILGARGHLSILNLVDHRNKNFSLEFFTFHRNRYRFNYTYTKTIFFF